MPRARIAIATCAGYDDLKVGDALLREALGARGCEAASVLWDQHGVVWDSFDLCLVRSTWNYHDKHAEFLAWAQGVEEATRLQNPANLITWNSEKTYLRELAAAGVRTVPTVWVEPGAAIEIDVVLQERGWKQAVIKPVVDLGARNLRRVKAGTGEAGNALEATRTRHEAMVQPFLPSLEEQGELSLIYLGGKLSHAVRKRPAPGDFRVQSIWGGTATPERPDPQHVEVAEQALAHLAEPPLYARIDLVNDLEAKPALIELELIEPNLYLQTDPSAAEHLAGRVIAQLS